MVRISLLMMVGSYKKLEGNMEYCKNCLMPTTKPGLMLNKEGICPACVNKIKKNEINYNARFKELEKLCDKYRSTDGTYDCIIAVSGGKDSTYQTYLFKEVLKMNPLLVSVGDPFTKTDAGNHNAFNIQNTFNCDMISLNLSPDIVKRMSRIAFEELGSPTWPVDRAIYTFPVKMAIKLNIPLLVYGENVSWEYGGVLDSKRESYSAIEQINNDVAKKVDFKLWYDNGIKKEEMNQFMYPSDKEISEAKLEPIFLSYFVNWDGYHNYKVASKYGFKGLEHEWKREGYIEDYDQIDSIAYLINVWMKYPKFGFGRATDVVGYWIRSGKIGVEEGKKIINENDHKLDRKILDDFLNFTGYSYREFWNIVDKFYSKELFVKDKDGLWELKVDRF